MAKKISIERLVKLQEEKEKTDKRVISIERLLAHEGGKTSVDDILETQERQGERLRKERKGKREFNFVTALSLITILGLTSYLGYNYLKQKSLSTSVKSETQTTISPGTKPLEYKYSFKYKSMGSTRIFNNLTKEEHRFCLDWGKTYGNYSKDLTEYVNEKGDSSKPIKYLDDMRKILSKGKRDLENISTPSLFNRLSYIHTDVISQEIEVIDDLKSIAPSGYTSVRNVEQIYKERMQQLRTKFNQDLKLELEGIKKILSNR